MAQQKATAIRLGTTGKAEVKSDFAEVRQSGEAAFKGIADRAVATGAEIDKQLKRHTANYERELAAQEAAGRRAAAAAEKMHAIIPRTAMQETVDRSAGLGGARLSQTGDYAAQGKSARESSAALRELLALEDAQQAKVAAIKAAIDPLAVSQARYSSAMQETIALRRADNISADEARQYQVLLKQQLDQSTAAHVQAGAGMRSHRAGMQQLGFQASDFFVQLTGGTSAIRALSQQAPQAIQAIAMMGDGAETSKGKFARFASFLGTGWGAAILVGVTLLGTLATALFDAGKESDKLGDKSLSLHDALLKVKEGKEAALKALKEYNAEQAKARASTEDMIKINLALAESELRGAIAIREKLKARLAEAGANAAANAGQGTGGAAGAYAGGQAAIAQAALGKQDTAIAELEQAARNLRIQDAGRDAKAAIDPLAAINNKYDDMAAAARRAAAGNTTLSKSLEALLISYERLRKKDLDAERERQRPARSGGGGPETPAGAASAGDMTALLKQLFPGVIVQDPTKHSKYVRGTKRISDHWSGRALDFTIPGMMAPADFDRVKQTLLGAGVEIRRGSGGNQQMFGPGRPASKPGDHDNHYHLAWKGRPSPESADRALERAAEEALRRQRDFEQERERLGLEELQLRRAGITNIDEIAGFEQQRSEVEEQKYGLAVVAKEKLGDLTQAQADELILQRAKIADLQGEAIERRRQADQIRAAGELSDADAATKQEILELQGGFARTAKDRRGIELQILALEKQQVRKHYEQTIALGQLGQATAEQVRIAKAGLRNMERTFSLREQGITQQTAGPLEAYAAGLDQSRDEIYERVQAFAVDELEWFRKGLGDAVTNMIGVRDPLLAQLIDMFIEQVIIRPIAESLQRSASGGGSKGFFAELFSVVADVAVNTLGGSTGSGSTSNSGSSSAKSAAKNATGTEHFSGGLTWLAENGPELVNLPRGSKVTPAAETRRLLGSANDNARPIVVQSFDLRGAVMTEDLLAQMDSRSQEAAEKATSAGISALLDQNRRSYGAVFASGRN